MTDVQAAQEDEIPEPAISRPRVGPAMKRVLLYLAGQHAPVTCAAVYRAARLDSGHLSGRMPLWRCEDLGLVEVDRCRCNRYEVSITDAGRDVLATGRCQPRPGWDDAMRWTPGETIEHIDTVLSEHSRQG
jgi:hypothetical protein